MSNPLKQAIDSGVKANETIAGLFARIGTTDHPRGFVLSAYRNANRALKTAISEPYPLIALSDTMNELRRTISSETTSLLTDAQGIGIEEAARQMQFYGVKTAVSGDPTGQAQRQAVVDAMVARVDAQEAMIQAMILAEAEPEQITGDEDRQGILKPSDIAVNLAALAATLLWSGFSDWASAHMIQSGDGTVFQKQAIAALDNRTTDCCIRVHGQIQPLDKPFKLTGTPRFADEMDWPGFHWWCRTSGVLYLPEYDDGLTAKMRDGADYWLSERAKGNYPDQHPADAFKH
jgi:hypothetical protein